MKSFGQNFIANVVPLTRIPLDRQQFFSYSGNKPMPPGSLVTVPLGSREMPGIVLKTQKNSKVAAGIKFKKIAKVIEENFVTKNQLALADFISKYYFCPLGIVLKSFAPKIVKKRVGKPIAQKSETAVPEIELTKEQLFAIKEITGKTANYLLFGPASSGKTEVYIHAAKEILALSHPAKPGSDGGQAQSKDAQVLVMVPELSLTPQAVERYQNALGSVKICTLHSKLSKGEFWENWQAIKSGKARVIISTRQGVFAPFKKLKLIVIDEEQDISFKQWDMNPRYDARTVAEKLAEIYNCPIVRGTATPSIESFYKASRKDYKLIQLPRLPMFNNQYSITNTILVDMKKERWAKNFSPLSKKLQYEISYILKQNGQVLLFVGRSAMSNYTICAKCKNVLRCARCDRALVYDSRGIYKCRHCNYKISAISACPKCGGLELKNVGAGTQKVEQEIKKLFPASCVVRADFDASKKADFWENTYRDFAQHKIDILIGTQMATKGWDFPDLGLVGIIDADSLFGIPDFSTNANGFFKIVQAAGRTARPKSRFPGTVIIQTFNPQNKTIQHAAARDYRNFFDEEIKERKILKYPPFSKLVKLLALDKNIKKVDEKARNVYNELTKVKNAGEKISEPYYPINPKIRGNWRKQILIKAKPERPLGAELGKIIEKLDSGWKIDVDPIGLN